MKRFMLIGLMCSVLVTSPISAWSWSDFAKGAAWTALGAVGMSALSALPTLFKKSAEDKDSDSFQDTLSFIVGESATGYVGTSLAGLAAVKCLNNPDVAQKFFGYNSTSAFAGVLTSSFVMWLCTHGISLAKFLKNTQPSRQQVPEWQWIECAQGAEGALKSSLCGGAASALFLKGTGSQNSFKENFGYNVGAGSCSAIRLGCTGLAAAALFQRPDVAEKYYGSQSPAYCSGRLMMGGLTGSVAAILAVQNY